MSRPGRSVPERHRIAPTVRAVRAIYTGRLVMCRSGSVLVTTVAAWSAERP